MEKKNNNGVIVGILIGIVIMLLVVGGLFLTNTISFNSKSGANDNASGNNINTNNSDTDFNKIYKWVFNYINNTFVYCGDNMDWSNDNDHIADSENPTIKYVVSKDFKSIKQLNSYVKTFVSNEMFSVYNDIFDSNFGVSRYKENDGKLYCLNPAKGSGLQYDEDRTIYKVIESNDSEINIIGYVAAYAVGDMNPTYLVTPIKLSKVNGNWLVSSYVNIFTGYLPSNSLKFYFEDVILNNKLNPNHKISINYLEKSYSTDEEIKKLGDEHVNDDGNSFVQLYPIYDDKGYVSAIGF